VRGLLNPRQEIHLRSTARDYSRPGRRSRTRLQAATLAAVPRLVGINHVALEVGDLEAALEWYDRIFDFEIVREPPFPHMAFLQMGDQFLNLTEGRSQTPDTHRHFGLVVDDKQTARAALEAAGAEILPGRGLDFLDPWGNHIQVVEYGDIQFSKTPEVMRGMGLELPKSDLALAELQESGLA
jgi:catechol 2,3-dioxygenase-like lactoylglutathione lyase family enzyme